MPSVEKASAAATTSRAPRSVGEESEACRARASDQPGAEKYVSQGSLRFTQEEVAEFAEEFHELQNRWRERTLGHDDGRTTYSIYQLVQPYPDLPESDDDTAT